MKNYDAGIDANLITLEVRVGTPAASYTTVGLLLPGKPEQMIAESSADNPNIPQKGIGTAVSLRNGGVVVTTNFDLTHIPAAQRQGQVTTLVYQCILNGGAAGRQVYTPDLTDVVAGPDYINVVVTMAIKIL